MDHRRLQYSYPPRPSPLGTSQETHTDQLHQFAGPFSSHEPLGRIESDKSRPYHSPASDSTSSPSQLYQSTVPRTSQTSLRGDAPSTYFPPRHGLTQVHRRHGSLETRNNEQTHRRNNSQPQTVRYREGLFGASVMNHTPSQHESARRTSQGSSGSSGLAGPSEQSAHPVFGNRQMPPPSPPHSYSSRAQSTHAPGGSHMSRDVPSTQAQRPGSSMSISAMLGSDSDRPAREPARESAPFFSRPPASAMFGNAAPSSSSSAMSPPTAPTRPSPLETSIFRRSRTPEKSFSKPGSARPYRSGSGGGSTLLGGEQSVFGGLTRSALSQYPEKPHSTHPSPRMSTAEPPYNEPRRLSLNGPIARPNSQPPHADTPTRAPGYSPISQPGGVVADRPFDSGPRPASGSYGSHESQHGRFGNIFSEHRSEETAQRDRERAQTHGPDAKLGQPGAYRYGSYYGERDPLERHPSASTWDHGRTHPPSPESKRSLGPEHGSGFGFGAIQSYTKSLGSQPGGNRQPQISLPPQNNQPTPPPHDPYPRQQTQPHRLGSTPAITASTAAASSGLAALADEGRRKGSDELLHHRSLLAVGADGKRGGRASPLPQAVQGAQAPFIGPSGEPAIKNDLGRVFSGIGSGVGGVTASTGGSGQSTPLGASPFKRDSLTGRSMNGDAVDDASKIGRPSSTADRRSRRPRDEEQMEIEASDPRGVLSARNARRSRHSHHHHHHHHHHRHKADEDAAALAFLHRPSSFFRRASPADPSLGHHHHQHHHHHHHHVPRPGPVPVSSPVREARITVKLEPLLSSIAHLPRHHLGSTLYTPRIGVPTAKSSAESSKFGYTTSPQPLPRFEKRENCTFTVRVPRFRIDQTHREEICARRALWGTGVYTDDSDPVAAAIHSGFIRGAWGEDVDESMLDLEIKDTYQHAPPPEPSTDDKASSPAKGPRLPPIPPADKDLHITLLILPRVDKYDSTLLFGLKSRKWDGRHDGMSFKVHAVDWVDEGVGRGEERSGEARRKRLRTLMQTGRICTGPAMAKMDGLRRSGVQVPRSIDGQGQDQPAAVQPVS
ncbi:hypothetical protein N7535_007214 [Penicillium sp. DV-2018c]|nr:hypothetical protein N7461_003238 [Penicillium sp. DV-2018c]KAJ5565576.1 hypothetical protein N7535_007214 [Penicillium sp. DV-2018c]